MIEPNFSYFDDVENSRKNNECTKSEKRNKHRSTKTEVYQKYNIFFLHGNDIHSL